MDLLLTNDDGYDSPGIHALADALGEIADVTIVAPETDQSAMGRACSPEVTLERRDAGYTVTGTPVDSVLVGIESLDLEPDVVVAGCNIGANLGGHALGRSGTVSAAVEATFFGLPSIAASLYVPPSEWPLDARKHHFVEAAGAVTFLVEHAMGTDAFSDGGYLNVNAPMPGESPAPMRLTRPSERYDMVAEREDDRITLYDRDWRERSSIGGDEPRTTDRGAVFRGEISVSALTAPHSSLPEDELRSLVEDYVPRHTADASQ